MPREETYKLKMPGLGQLVENLSLALVSLREFLMSKTMLNVQEHKYEAEIRGPKYLDERRRMELLKVRVEEVELIERRIAAARRGFNLKHVEEYFSPPQQPQPQNTRGRNARPAQRVKQQMKEGTKALQQGQPPAEPLKFKPFEELAKSAETEIPAAPQP